MEEQNNNYRDEFYKKFKTVCVHALEGFEKERKTWLNISIALFVVPVLVLIACCYVEFTSIAVNGGSIDLQKIFVPVVISGALVFGIYAFIAKTFENKVKGKVMPILCGCFGNLQWSQGVYPSLRILKDAELINNYDKCTVDDVFTGSVKDVPLEIAELKYVKIERYTDSDGRTRTREHIVWKGVLVQFKMNKNFSGHTIVKPDALVKNSGLSKLKHTTLEDVIFEKKFDVFTDDEVEARYLLTTAFMERLTNIVTAFKAKNISCAFYQDKLILAIGVNQDLFSVASLFKPVNDEKQFFTMFEEINSLVHLIEHFKLNQKIGL